MTSVPILVPGIENLPFVRCSALVVGGVPAGYSGEDSLFKSTPVGIPSIGDCDAGLDICGCVEGEGLPVTASSGATVRVTKEPGITGLWKGVNFLRCRQFRIVT